MRLHTDLRASGFLLVVMLFAVWTVGLPRCAAEEASPKAPEKAEAAPAATPAEATPAAPAEEKGEKEATAAEPVATTETPEGALIGAAVEAPPTAATILELAVLKGPKKSIAVMDFENKSNFAGEWNLGEGMADMLTTVLAQTNRFVVVERPKIKRILAEQNLGSSGKTVTVEEARTGKLIPAQTAVAGAVTEFSFEKQKTGAGTVDKSVGVGNAAGVAHVGMTLTMFDTTTGEVLFTEKVEKSASYSGIERDYAKKAFAIGGGRFQETPLGKATDEAINEAVYRIAVDMEKVPWKGNVILVQGEKVLINCGTRDGIQPGQKFVVYAKGEELTDPETREILGVQETKAGMISAVEVKDKYSIARIERGQGFKRGDILRLE